MPSIALPVSLRGQLLSGSRFSPLSLFTASEPGLWYDPSDLTTMFEDTAGTIPVTTPGQSVARINDKSGRGNNATQPTAASRPTYGVHPVVGRRNLLTLTEQFDNAGWGKFGTVLVTPNTTLSPVGDQTADTLAITATSSGIFQPVPALPLTTYTASVWVRAEGAVTSRLVINTNLSDPVFLTVNATTQWQRVSLSKVTQAATTSVTFQIDAGNGPNTVYVWGAQVELGASATAYQRVTTSFDVTEAGVPSVSYLSFDGVDDFLVTPTITPGTDKVQVFAGVRKLTDAAIGIVAESSSTINSNNGAFLLALIAGSPSTWQWLSKGTTIKSASGGPTAAPSSSVLTGIGDISGDLARLRSNGIQLAENLTDQGTGNFLAYPIYIGRRGGVDLPLNGQIYSLIVRFGSNLDAGAINSTETFVNEKTGAY